MYFYIYAKNAQLLSTFLSVLASNLYLNTIYSTQENKKGDNILWKTNYMHLKKVAVPVRLDNNHIGEATITAARTRPKFVGGVRAKYNEALLWDWLHYFSWLLTKITIRCITIEYEQRRSFLEQNHLCP